MGIFNFFIDVLSKFKPPEETERYHYNRFKEYLLLLDKDDKHFNEVSRATELCNSALNIAKQRLVNIKRHQELMDILGELECYENLTEEDAAYLKDLINRFVSLTKERNVLRYQIIGFDNSLDKVSEYENDAPQAIIQMEEAERKQRILKQDLGYLEGEKSELEYEKENLEFGLKFIYNFSIAIVIFFAAATTIIAMLYVFRNMIIFFPLAIMSFLLIFLVSLIYIFKRKIRHEIKINVKKQLKAVELLNKKRVVYAYYTNFLRYEYKKYKVKSSEALRINLSEYSHYKHITSRYDSIRNIMFQTQDMLEDFLLKKNIKNINASIESFANTINIDDKKEYYKETLHKKLLLEERLSQLDNEHETIWDELTILSDNDKTKDKIIGKIVEAYMNEVSGLASNNDEAQEEGE